MSNATLDMIPGLDAEFAKRMAELHGDGDEEWRHGEADRLLCELLTEMGFLRTVEAWKKVEKWYA